MSACDILMQNSSKELPLKASKNEAEKDLDVIETIVKDTEAANVADSSENEKTKKKRISYSKEELLELRSAPASLRRPECLSEEFFKDGIWDIEAWHKSSTSRSASPAVDGKCVTFESGKKIELLDSTIELAPHRRSFCQGCHVQTPAEIESREKDGPMKRLGGKAGLGGDSKTSFYEGRDRLTGRAGLRRKTMEKSVLRENRSDNDVKRLSKSNFDDDVDKELRNIHERNNRGRGAGKENRGDERKFKHEREGQRRTDSYDSMPEWMTDGPTSQLETIELKGFNKEIEEERSAMRNETKQRSVIKPQLQRSRKSSKGSSRSSTPNDKKQGGFNGNTDRKERASEPKGTVDDINRDVSRKYTPTDKIFDENAYIDLMDYLPPHLFADDYTNETSSQSKFSQWFRSRSASSNDGSRSSSAPLSFEATQRHGFPSQSPTVPMQPYFTPIQPAPATHQYENPIAVSPLLELFQKRKSPTVEKSKEVKGRMTLKDIEPDIPKSMGEKPDKTEAPEDNKHNDLTAFHKLVSSMKAAGQLPEKPAPVVSGLPEHLLPKPPKRTSPSFEKLKRALSRSPSPVTAGRMSPLNFINRPVSPLVAPLAERLLSPEFFQQSMKQRSVSPGSFFSNFQDGFGKQKAAEKPNTRHQQTDQPSRAAANQQRSNSSNSGGLMTPESIRHSRQPGSAKIPAAFLPTSVIKKMHSEKQDGRDRQEIFDNSLAAKLDFTQASQFDAMQQQHDRRNGHALEHAMKRHSDDYIDGRNMQRPLEELLGGKSSNPGEPGNRDVLSHRMKADYISRTGRGSQPTGLVDEDFSRSGMNPMSSQNRSVGSSSLFARNHSDLETGQKSLFDLNQDMPARRQQHVSSNKPGVLSGLAVDDNRAGGMDIGGRGLGTNMPSKGAINQLSNGNQSNILNQSSVSRGQVPQKPTAPHAQMNQFPQGRNAPQNNVRLPMPMSNNVPFNRPNIPAATAAMAAHIMQQQFIHQAARAHLQAAQILQQQQQQNLLRTQMQAAMAQAYARGQAAKAMMYNPRVVANNLQAVAQQMGLRAPQPGQGMGKPIPTPLLNQPKTDEPKQSEDKPTEDQSSASPLSKWFNVDAIKKTPPAPTQDAKGKVISVEDLERSQK